jgi:predicted nucleotidyltransferase
MVSGAENIIGVFRGFFEAKPEFRLVILYGSAAKACLGKHSDIDVAVSGTGPLDRELLYTTAGELSRCVNREVDVVDLHLAEGLILYRVMTEGKRIKTDPDLYVKFRLKALGYKEDFKPFQDMIRAARLRRFMHGS